MIDFTKDHFNADEKPSPKGLSPCEQPWCGCGVREQDEEGCEAPIQGLEADEAEVGFYAYQREREDQATQARQKPPIDGDLLLMAVVAWVGRSDMENIMKEYRALQEQINAAESER